MLGACDTGEPRQAGPGRRSGADLSASGRGGASRSPPRHFGEERPSKSFGIYFDSRTYWFEASSGWPLVLMAGPLRWAVDSAGGTKPAKPSGPGFLRGALPGRVLFPCWCGRSGGAPASASASMTATDGPFGPSWRVSRSNGTPRWEARGSMLRWTFPAEKEWTEKERRVPRPQDRAWGPQATQAAHAASAESPGRTALLSVFSPSPSTLSQTNVKRYCLPTEKGP